MVLVDQVQTFWGRLVPGKIRVYRSGDGWKAQSYVHRGHVQAIGDSEHEAFWALIAKMSR